MLHDNEDYCIKDAMNADFEIFLSTLPISYYDYPSLEFVFLVATK
jgi:hypothetical protein